MSNREHLGGPKHWLPFFFYHIPGNLIFCESALEDLQSFSLSHVQKYLGRAKTSYTLFDHITHAKHHALCWGFTSDPGSLTLHSHGVCWGMTKALEWGERRNMLK